VEGSRNASGTIEPSDHKHSLLPKHGQGGPAIGPGELLLGIADRRHLEGL